VPIGEACGENADYTLVTELDGRYGNRFEDVAEAIAEGIRHRNGEYEIIKDHREAIRHAISLGGAGDLVAICGRGHLTGQIFDGKIYPLPSDADLAREAYGIMRQ
jgi:UDP-N-acetylmuramoyl-L-alanyl-D-glutamate--2,6-diaminopimelate ligase